MPPSKSPYISRDGWLVQSAENVPVLGYLIALYDLVNGDIDRALRASARSTYASVTAASSMIGGIVGGGPMGAGLGAAVATPLGMNLHSRIAASIQDPIIRNEVLVPFTPEAVLEETVSNGLLYGIGAHVTERLADSFGQVVTKRGAVKMLVGGLKYLFRLFF